ncbi:MAG: hypothetical protein AAGK04_04515 [Planctomycetota bacterium]
MNPLQAMRRVSGRAASGSGFTLIETLVAVGVIAVVGVGLASIFGAFSDVVSSGRQISRFAQTAAIIERQMREDFRRMNREGYLVIRQQFAQADPMSEDVEADPDSSAFDGVGSSLDDAEPRLRRIDEIVFFAQGDFESARQPLHASLAVTSSEARVYYGHGRKARLPEPGDDLRSLALAPYYYDADVQYGPGTSRIEADADDRGLGVAEDENPNEFAGDWTLLRHVTLLAPPSDTLPDTTEAREDLFGSGPPISTPDQDPFNATFPNGTPTNNTTLVYQGQPAVRFLFRDVLRNLAGQSSELTATVRTERDTLSPRFESGLVDIALTTFDETASVIDRLNAYPPIDQTQTAPTGVMPLPPGVSPINSVPLETTIGRFLTSASGTSWGDLRVGSTPSQNRLSTMRAWMEQLLPAYSLVVSPNGTPRGERIRAELEPTAFEAVITDSGGDITSGAAPGVGPLAIEVARSDQLALSMSNLAVRCTEFIVEWSFGQTYTEEFYATGGTHSRREGELVWYGSTVTDDFTTLEPAHITRYPGGDWIGGEPPVGAYQPFESHPSMVVQDHVVSSSLIYGLQAPPPTELSLDALTCTFGRLDLTYPQAGALLPADAPLAVPMAWPRLIRVTFTLADPSDLSVEETFQYVFDVPAGPEL